jgi:hypothetical protein
MEILTFSLNNLSKELNVKPIELTINKNTPEIPEIILLTEGVENQNRYYRHIVNMYGQCVHVYVHQDLDNISGLDRILKYFEDQFRKLWGYLL